MIKKVPFTAVELTGGMWKRLMDTNRARTLPAQYEQCRSTGRLEALKLSLERVPSLPQLVLRALQILVPEKTCEETAALGGAHRRHDREFLLPREIRVEELLP